MSSCLCRHAEAQLSGTETSAIQLAAPSNSISFKVVPLNAAATASMADAVASSAASGSASSAAAQEEVPCFVLLDDAWRATSHLQSSFAGMQRPVFGITLPQVCAK